LGLGTRNSKLETHLRLLPTPGKLDPGENPLDTARRELAEETGYACERLVRLGCNSHIMMLNQD